MPATKFVVFTDLDGTLLDHETYSWEAARPALERLRRREIPLVLCTSKTRAEVEVWRQILDNGHPFIVENGGAVFLPRGYFPFPVEGASPREPYDAIEFGARYKELVRVLAEVSRASGCRVRGFHDMSDDEVAEVCGLSPEEARLAKQREYDEPFEALDPESEPQLLGEIARLGKRWTRGGRFYHITGGNDKAGAVRALTRLYGQIHRNLRTIGLGDGLNDAEFLAVVDLPVLIRSPQSQELERRVPHGRRTSQPGPEGWNEALLEMIPE